MDGGDGKNGTPGGLGENGGNFIGYGEQFNNLGYLKII